MRRLKPLRLFAIPVIILALLSCNAVPAAVRGLFASPTPTATHTPTATSTPTNTPTPTSTPLPAVNLYPVRLRALLP